MARFNQRISPLNQSLHDISIYYLLSKALESRVFSIRTFGKASEKNTRIPIGKSKYAETFCLEPTTFSRDPRLFIWDPRPLSQDPRPFSQDPRLFFGTHDFLPTTIYPRLFTHDPRLFTHDPRLLASLGVVPDELIKDAKIIFKSGVRSEVNNYRPISVLSVIAKVFEKIVFNQFYEYSSSNDLLSTNQSGFRPFHSTVTALHKDTIHWLSNMNIGKINIAVFIDLKKAFDTVDHVFL